MSVFEAINPHRKLADSQLADSQTRNSQTRNSQTRNSQTRNIADPSSKQCREPLICSCKHMGEGGGGGCRGRSYLVPLIFFEFRKLNFCARLWEVLNLVIACVHNIKLFVHNIKLYVHNIKFYVHNIKLNVHNIKFNLPLVIHFACLYIQV